MTYANGELSHKFNEKNDRLRIDILKNYNFLMTQSKKEINILWSQTGIQKGPGQKIQPQKRNL
jgi:hypothetical protein